MTNRVPGILMQAAKWDIEGTPFQALGLKEDMEYLLAENKRLRDILFAHHVAGERIAGERCEFCPPNFWQEEKP